MDLAAVFCVFYQPVTSKLRAAFSLHFWYRLYAFAALPRRVSALSLFINAEMASCTVYASGHIRLVVHKSGWILALFRCGEKKCLL